MKPQNTKKVIKDLKKQGYENRANNGGHDIWTNGSVTVAIPRHGKEIAPGTMRQMMSQGYKPSFQF